MKRRILPLLLAAAALALSACSPSPQSDNTLVVGMELSYPPFETSNEKNEPAGISVDLARALGESLGRPVRIENITFPGLIPALRTGKIDCIISSMTATEERTRSIAFSDPYLRTGLCLLVSKDSDITSIADLDQPGRSVAVKQGTTGQLYAMANIKQARVLTLEKESSAALEVAQGKADAFVYDQLSTYKNWRRFEDQTRPILLPFKEESWAIGLRIDDAELLQEVNAFLARFRAEGGFEKLGDRYLAEEKAAFAQLGYPFVF